MAQPVLTAPAAQIRIAVGLGLALVAAGLACIYLRDPNVPGAYPPCPTFALAQVRCPGCGTLRALHALLHLDLGTAWDDNPLAVLAVPLMLWGVASLGLLVVRGRGLRLPPLVPRCAPRLTLAGLALYTVARNL